jgi:hypothetical protein
MRWWWGPLCLLDEHAEVDFYSASSLITCSLIHSYQISFCPSTMRTCFKYSRSFNKKSRYQIYCRWIFIVLAHWNNSPRIDMSLHSDTLSWCRANQSLLFLLNAACLAEDYHHTKFNRFGGVMVSVLASIKIKEKKKKKRKKRARLECSRSWVRALLGSNHNKFDIYFFYWNFSNI